MEVQRQKRSNLVLSKNISYITYQSFPAETANSIQTISNIVELAKKGYKVSLIFPNRERNSSANITDIQKFYNFTENFEVFRLKHPLPFGKIKIFNRTTFHISHFLWSFFVIKFKKKFLSVDLILTRSDWVFYFLSKKNKNVIFECHSESRLRKIILKKSMKSSRSKIIFITKSLKEKYSEIGLDEKQAMILDSGFRNKFYLNPVNKNNKQSIFVGNLTRFGESRNIEFILDCFQDKRLSDHTLKIIGGPNEYANKLRNIYLSKGSSNIEIMGHLNQKETSKLLMKSAIGILINSDSNVNNIKHTSPLKYFEYLAAKLKVVAVNFESHKNLPLAEYIHFFEPGNKEQFINLILTAGLSKEPNYKEVENYSYSNRIEKLIDFARLEGLEPPTL